MAKVTLAGLQAELAAMTKARDTAIDEREDLRGKLSASQERGDQQTADLAAARKRAREDKERIEGLEAEVDQLGRSLRAYKGSATKARAEAEILRGEKSPEARNVGALPAAADDRERHRRAVRLEDALRNGPTTIVFSDGKREIRELAPLIVTGDAWRRNAQGEELKAEPLLEPGDMTKPIVTIAGFGLLDEAGEQVGWRQLPEPIEVPRNGRVRLPKGTIRFGF